MNEHNTAAMSDEERQIRVLVERMVGKDLVPDIKVNATNVHITFKPGGSTRAEIGMSVRRLASYFESIRSVLMNAGEHH